MYHSRTKKNLFCFLMIVLSVFLIVLTASTFVGTLNKIKEGKNIDERMETISVNATGEVYAKPDLAVINISVITEKKTVDEAVSENTNKMNAVIEAIKSQGVEAKDLKTTTFSVNPRYDYPRDDELLGSKRVLAGYEVSQRVEVKIRDLTKVGSITESATNAGANDIGNLYFTVEDRDQLENQAKEEAIKKAKEKAANLAGQLEIKLGKIVNFYEDDYYPAQKSVDMMGMGIGGATESSISPTPTIETGENKITVSVNVIYEIE
jgi:uncharacterized protein